MMWPSCGDYAAREDADLYPAVAVEGSMVGPMGI
jgi:hypothetical protein